MLGVVFGLWTFPRGGKYGLFIEHGPRLLYHAFMVGQVLQPTWSANQQVRNLDVPQQDAHILISTVLSVFRDTLISTMNQSQRKRGNRLQRGRRVEIYVLTTFLPVIHRWDLSRVISTRHEVQVWFIFRQAQKSFTSYLSISNQESALVLVWLGQSIVCIKHSMSSFTQWGEQEVARLVGLHVIHLHAFSIPFIELSNFGVVAMHYNNRKCILWWTSDKQNQPRFLEVEYHHNSSNSKVIELRSRKFNDIPYSSQNSLVVCLLSTFGF